MNRTRRQVVLGLAGGLCGAPFFARAQRVGQLPLVGFVLTTAPLETMRGDPPAQLVVRGFLAGMREHGYVEGRDMLIERRSAEGKPERLPRLLRDLAESGVDVIVVTGNTMVKHAMQATSSVPIVVAGMSESLVPEYVGRFSTPEKNLTGVTAISGAIGPKRLEILRDLLPGARRVSGFYVPASWDAERTGMLAAAKALGFDLEPVVVRMPDVGAAFAIIEKSNPDAIYVSGDAPFYVVARRIVDFAARIRVPDFHYHSVAVEAGALASFGHDAFDIFRRSARYVVEILKGAKTRELAVDRIERYSLVLNLGTAKRLGIVIPEPVLLRADRVIE